MAAIARLLSAPARPEPRVMRLGIIDLGTNSVRFDVHERDAHGGVRRLHREKRMIRLGEGVFVTGRLDRGAIRRTLAAFRRFKQVAERLDTGRILAYGTSALREAADRDRLVALVHGSTGIVLRVLPGTEEARLIARGVLAHARPARARFALVDIGGGSTEISLCRGRRALRSASLALGTSRLQQVFLRTLPPPRVNVAALRSHIRATLGQRIGTRGWRGARRIVGSSGTVRALARIVRKRGGGRSIGAAELRRLVEEMAGMSRRALVRIPGMEKRRVDMIVAGGILLEECARALGAREVVPTRYALRDGILEEALNDGA